MGRTLSAPRSRVVAAIRLNWSFKGPILSGLAAIFHFDEKGVEPGSIERLTQEMRYRGPDGRSHWHGKGAAIGFCALNVTAEDKAAKQPILSDDGNLVLIFDGYLHDPIQLRADLAARGAIFRTRCDAEIVLRAYQIWGDDCPKHLPGEYAFVIWDARRRRAYLARDHAGLRPLHYHWDGDRLVVASDVGAVLAAPGVARKVNHVAIAQTLANEWIIRGETIWKNVESQLPATWMTFERKKEKSGTYWNPQEQALIRYDRDQHYADHYLAMLENSVRQCSRSDRPIACDVSGGLDSSAIFALAEGLCRKGDLLSPGLNGYTLKFDDGSDADELIFAREVAAHVGAEVQEVEPFSPDLDWFAERARADRDVAPYPNGSMSINISDALVGDGCRVSLTGVGGDEWLDGRHFYFAEQLAERDWAGIYESFRENWALDGFGAALNRLARYGAFPHAPAPFQRVLRRLRRPDPVHALRLRPELKRALKHRRARDDARVGQPTSDGRRWWMLDTLRDPYSEWARAIMNRQAARLGHELRYPMYSRPFVEFAFATPENIRRKGTKRKQVHVDAMRSILPDLVRHRQSKAEFSVAYEKYIERLSDAAAASPVVAAVASNLSGVEKFRRLCRSLPVCDRPIWEIWTGFACAGLVEPDGQS